ncbi:hypothetical protein KUL25_05180 [Rhodobacteraceae bacterium N5(2021)]|uniref:Hpr(Ser) kinase/phosphatase n=1 Tax=Gymnodinialimonas phycosphaerae TaxID=2841589 RepID=A0A975YGW6_9RHOB|nr:hypothetical protein [Gymnodinialimonas phycosphaerae]MBY4892154.1 hypothetical protein [Gymnodinialimonas phycosphaerae]
MSCDAMNSSPAISNPTYSLFGLTVETSQPLFRVPPITPRKTADLKIEFAGQYDPAHDLHDWENVTFPLRRHGGRIQVAQCKDRIRLIYDTKFGTVVAVSDLGATSIKIARCDGATDADLASVCLGTIMGFALRRRGLACLHASVVRIGDRSYAFLGRSGTGKSTLAAAFVRYAGAQLVADDIAALEMINGTWTARTGYPASRLNGDAVRAIGNASPQDTDFVYASQLDKRYVWLPAQCTADRPMPVSAVFDLGDTTSDQDLPLNEAQSLRSLSRQSYASYALIDRADVRAEFQALAQLSRDVPFIPCAGRRGLGYLPDHVRRIQEIGSRVS